MIDLGYVRYKPVSQRTPNTQYIDLMRRIRNEGRWVKPIQGDPARMIFGAQIEYDMEEGFPLDTHRDLSGSMFEGAINEHAGFLNGAETLDELKSYGMPEVFWKRWVTEEKCAMWGLSPGHLGTASYGAAWAKMPTRDGNVFNQIDALVDGIRRKPFLRTWQITTWYPPEIIGPEGTRKVVVAPCHGDVHVIIDPETGELMVHHKQRSCDIAVGGVLNTVQYAAFGLALAKLTGYRFSRYVHTFSDVHIYRMQFEKIDELLSRPTMPFPTVAIDAVHERLQDLRGKHFTLSDYQAGEKMIIPTPT
jgi:thymidylate synthase